MASFADILSRQDSDAIHAYVISRALHQPTLIERTLNWLGEHACVPPQWLAD